MIPSCFLPRLRRCHGLLIAALPGVARLSAQPTAEAEDIRGAKPLVEIPVPERTPLALWIGIAVGLVVVLIAWLVWKKLRSSKRLASPSGVALASLADLETNREALAAEAFADRAAQTVRNYISGRFGLAAPRRTTEEFLRDLAKDESSPLAGEGDHLRGFLKSCDLAKFAGSQLDAAQRGELLQAARGFINATAAPVAAAKPAVQS